VTDDDALLFFERGWQIEKTFVVIFLGELALYAVKAFFIIQQSKISILL
jgi:hypothetical protein